MAHGQKPKCFDNGSSATKHPNIIPYQGTVKMRVNAQRLSPCRVTDKRIRVEIPNICNIRSTAQSQTEFVKND